MSYILYGKLHRREFAAVGLRTAIPDEDVSLRKPRPGFIPTSRFCLGRLPYLTGDGPGTLYTSLPLSASTTRWLVRFGYDGTTFHGWARQPGIRTVEGQILLAVVRRGIAPSVGSAKIGVASRTDRGVSAVGNALTLTSAFPPTALLRALNGIEPDIFFTAATAVPESFRVRSAVRRVYPVLPGTRLV